MPVSRKLAAQWGQQKPETDEVAPCARDEVVAGRRPAEPGVVVPEAAAEHAGRARDSPLRIGHTPGGIRPLPVLTPLKDIPNHVIQSPSVRCISPDRRGCVKIDSVRIRGRA